MMTSCPKLPLNKALSIQVKSYKGHPDFHPDSYKADVAVMKLSSALDYSRLKVRS